MKSKYPMTQKLSVPANDTAFSFRDGGTNEKYMTSTLSMAQKLSAYTNESALSSSPVAGALISSKSAYNIQNNSLF